MVGYYHLAKKGILKKASSLSPSVLWRRMIDKGLIIKTEVYSKSGRARLDIKRVIAGISKRVIILSAELIESG